jgi:hypothetical protein
MFNLRQYMEVCSFIASCSLNFFLFCEMGKVCIFDTALADIPIMLLLTYYICTHTAVVVMLFCFVFFIIYLHR